MHIYTICCTMVVFYLTFLWKVMPHQNDFIATGNYSMEWKKKIIRKKIAKRKK